MNIFVLKIDLEGLFFLFALSLSDKIKYVCKLWLFLFTCVLVAYSLVINGVLGSLKTQNKTKSKKIFFKL